ncbi:protein far1-related sequence 5-like [Gigaspora margarita]|uniref:Protein far1-related sequence 5-like n=1 Tax=Gigaspora margarita TaxID=4874 RepID=A0A8H3XBH3_GIGMA|nr:protein far1-related sequence 5-like [Gigaspora margarita]
MALDLGYEDEFINMIDGFIDRKKCSIEGTSKENIQVLISDPIVIKYRGRPAIKRIKALSESDMQHSRANNSTMSLPDPNLRMRSIEKLDNTFASRVPFEPINANELYKTNKNFSTESSTPAIKSNNNEVKHKYIYHACGELGHNARSCSKNAK